MKKLFLLLVLAFWLSSCVSSNFTLTDTAFPPLSPDAPVLVILPHNEIQVTYREIGVVQIRQENNINLSRVIEKAKDEARLRGGDVIIQVSEDSKVLLSTLNNQISTDEVNYYLFVVGKIMTSEN